MTSILIIEDDRDIALSLKYNLEKAGPYRVDIAHDGRSGLRKVARERPGLVLLDLNLPGMDGLEVCRQIRLDRNSSSTAIIMLTARADEEQKVQGLDLGADDYIVKPFSVKEVAARVRAQLRRQEPAAGAETAPERFLLGAALEMDMEGRTVLADGRQVELTRKEFDLLASLIRNRGRVLTRDRLLQQVWGYEYPGETRTVDVHVRRLRQKLGEEAAAPIETVVGVGYRYRSSS